MKIIIQRGSNEIGGTCIELSTDKTKLLLDIGSPLSPDSTDIEVEKINPDAVLVSHPHQDHYGLIDRLDKEIPVYIGELGKKLINATRIFLNKKLPENNFHHFEAWKRFEIGDFCITPYLVDHSSVDAYAFLLEAEGKKIFYSGDFRAHGRKGILFEKFIKNTPPEVKNADVLFLEGTMLGRSNEDFKTEDEVEEKITYVLKNSNDVCFLISSSQNIDRVVTAYKSVKQSGRFFVIDIYTAWILKQVSENKNVNVMPNMNWGLIKVLSKGMSAANHYKTLKANRDFFERFIFDVYNKNVLITHEEILDNPSKYFIKNNYVEYLIKILNLNNPSVIYSLWKGYMEKEYNPGGYSRYNRLKDKYNFIYAHCSGHAFEEDLKKFVKAIEPKKIEPIHTEHKELYEEIFGK